MFKDDLLLPLSGLQHLVFCERQWALIHLEQAWEENRLTAEGRVLHERAHDGAQSETRGDLRTARGLRLCSRQLGLSGQADVVEFQRIDTRDDPALLRQTVVLPRLEGRWRVYPVEYKRGKPKSHRADEVQLCAQAICLEEMLDVEIPDGALFYGEPRRRTAVPFDATLRTLVGLLATRMHDLHQRGHTPPPIYEKRCEQCSLIAVCQPRSVSSEAQRRPTADAYLAQAWRQLAEDKP